MSELKPCPFCGGAAKIHSCAELENETARIVYHGKCGVHCTECHVATLPCIDEEQAARFWNRRADNER